jgi:hypothetical protein
MKKTGILFSAVFLAAMNAAAYFDGGISGVSGPNGYRGSKLELVVGSGNIALSPSMSSYTSDALDKTYRAYALRGAWETSMVTVGAEAGAVPEVNDYSNKFAGGDVTLSLTPGSGGKSRLAGPGARLAARGGEGVTRIDVGAGLRQTEHKYTGPVITEKTEQTQYSLFAGAKLLLVNLSGSYTGYSYGSRHTAPLIAPVSGHSFAYGAAPKSSVNARLDLPGYPMITPFVAFTGTKYKDAADSSAYLFGAYLDLNMVTANVGWQLFDNGHARDSFVSVGAGLKF